MALMSLSQIGKAIRDEGKFHYQYLRKSTFSPTTVGFFIDMNQTSLLPKYNAFVGAQLAFTPLTGSANNGIYTGPSISGHTKYLASWYHSSDSSGSAISTVYLNDYLGFYPLIDLDSADLQETDNTQTLTRYTDGEGVRIVLIVQAPMTVTGPLTITYTNSQGVSGRTVTFNLIVGLAIGVCASGTGTVTTAGTATPFFPLANGDTGVRSIESFQLASTTGGFICAALVKPIATTAEYAFGCPVEKYFGFSPTMVPEIKDGAYLNLMMVRGNNAAGTITSEFVFVNI